MPDFAPGNMTFTISVQDTFEVDVTCGVNKVLNIKSNVGTANSTRISRIALRRTYPQTLLWNRDLKLIGKFLYPLVNFLCDIKNKQSLSSCSTKSFCQS